VDIEPLLLAGANEVIAAEREAAVEITSHVLKRYQIDQELLARYSATIRGHTEVE